MFTVLDKDHQNLQQKTMKIVPDKTHFFNTCKVSWTYYR